MADAGYGTAKNYIYAQEQQADVILRVTPKAFCLYGTDGEKISIVSLLKQAQEQGKWLVDIFGLCRYKNKTGFIRMVAQKLPEEQAEKSRKRKQRKASKNQRAITQDTLFCAGYIVVITTLGVEYSGEENLYLYRRRWQVELLFKRLKQNFCITTTKAGSKQYAEAMILLQLILWGIAERQAFLCECYRKEKTKEEKIIFSTYENCSILLTIHIIKCCYFFYYLALHNPYCSILDIYCKYVIITKPLWMFFV